ncbi:MAG: hypothetical protein JO197_23275 [Acidobacteria bacterium]|nr:hypothetical protein [Acidobacteriota bacterium]MBV9477870.1 hypothetical protein [Acidobacteriota bacterium]
MSRERRIGLLAVSGGLLFLAARIPLLVVRPAFYDERFTMWLVAQSPSQILAALRHDSGPPLYYLLVHFLGARSLVAIRAISLVAAAGAWIAIACARRVGEWRWLACIALAVYPPAALMAIDARAYALCALFVTLALVAWDAGRVDLAALALVGAAYTHDYAFFFFPLLLVAARERRVRAALAFLGATILAIPALLLARVQPAEAIAWLRELQLPPWQPLLNVSFAGRYAQSLFPPSPPIVVAIALAIVITAAVCSRSRAFAVAVAIPLACAIGFSLAGHGVYFPLRFESVLAPAFVLWFAAALGRCSPRMRLVLFGGTVAIGACTIANGIRDLASRPSDPFALAARAAVAHVAPREPLVASGFLWLETVSAGRANAIALPREQAVHPGWRARNGVTASELDALPDDFVWLGERGAPELRALASRFALQRLYVSPEALVLRARRPRAFPRLTGTLHSDAHAPLHY